MFINNKLVNQIEGDDEFSEFGMSISYGDPFGNKDFVLAVGSPAKSELIIYHCV